jgi:hypothetical protein
MAARPKGNGKPWASLRKISPAGRYAQAKRAAHREKGSQIDDDIFLTLRHSVAYDGDRRPAISTHPDTGLRLQNLAGRRNTPITLF